MKIAIIGATGNVGTRIIKEALSREHSVTAIARSSSNLPEAPNLTCINGDLHNTDAIAAQIKGHDVVISSVKFLLASPEQLVKAVRQSGVKRYIVVGGAGSLEISPGKLNVESADFPAIYKEEATKGKLFLDYMRKVSDLEWTMLSPSALFVEGDRTGKFRLGTDTLLTAADGKSWISFEDYAIALLDEVEQPQNIRSRFTVGY